MSYNFLDCDINSTSFGRLDAPDAVASTATARIWATAEDFAGFAATMSPITVRLVCGKVNLAVAEINPAKLLSIVPSDIAGLIDGSREEIRLVNDHDLDYYPVTDFQKKINWTNRL